jgi:hypothetical protein
MRKGDDKGSGKGNAMDKRADRSRSRTATSGKELARETKGYSVGTPYQRKGKQRIGAAFRFHYFGASGREKAFGYGLFPLKMLKGCGTQIAFAKKLNAFKKLPGTRHGMWGGPFTICNVDWVFGELQTYLVM